MNKPQLEIRTAEEAFIAGERLYHPVTLCGRVAGVAAPFGVLVGVPLREAVEAADAGGDGADGAAGGEGVAVGVGDVGADGDPWGGVLVWWGKRGGGRCTGVGAWAAVGRAVCRCGDFEGLQGFLAGGEWCGCG
jgi:hypothetical protein